mmetsp:Transcript_2972/g.7108  ORF Transcript_2972/g.7108 Transcript_2972/m.7108 type:complete len:332 (-) Transcript_2972:82-1077(-)
MVALREDPSIEVGRHVLAHVHLSAVLVVVHLLVGDSHALLEGDGIFVVPGIDLLGDAAVRAIRPDDDIDLEGLLDALARCAVALREVVVGEDVGLVLALGQGHRHEEAVDEGAAALVRSLAQEIVHDFAAHHSDELIVFQGLADLHLLVRGRDHGHLPDFPVHDVHGQVELLEHAEGNGTSARLAVVELALDEVRLNAGLGERLRAACPSRAAAHHGHTQFTALGQRGAGADHHASATQRRLRLDADEGRGRRGPRRRHFRFSAAPTGHGRPGHGRRRYGAPGAARGGRRGSDSSSTAERRSGRGGEERSVQGHRRNRHWKPTGSKCERHD